MTDLLENFAEIVISHQKLIDKIDDKISEFKAEIVFTDGSVLDFSEIKVFGINKRKYSFHWMNAKFELLIRWDNALHHKQIATFPHHKHLGKSNIIEESYDISLEGVLEIIQKAMLNV